MIATEKEEKAWRERLLICTARGEICQVSNIELVTRKACV